MRVERNEQRSRYELVVDDRVVGIADYEPNADGTVLTFPHTQVDPSMRGQGLGDELLHGALDDVRARGAKVRPLCWFVDDFMRLHPDYADLRAA